MSLVPSTQFTCPNCGSHMFGTFKYHEVMGRNPESAFYNKGFVHGESYGTCNRNHHEPTDCRFMWHRTPEEDAKVIHRPSHEETMEWFEERRKSWSEYMYEENAS